MNLTTSEEEPKCWLDTATAKLPSQVADWVRDELQAHYQDAFENPTGRGLDYIEARRLALFELGHSALTASRLQKTHFSRRD
ncbi:MAG TPA: hypothetical protein VF784_06540 [Anaerolineales bacterium]